MLESAGVGHASAPPVLDARTVALLRGEVNPNKARTMRDLGPIELGDIGDAIAALPPEQWDTTEDREANYNKGGAIRQASHIIFRFCDKRTVPFHCYDLPVWSAWRDRVMPLIDAAVRPYGYRAGFCSRIMLAMLPAGSFIPRHVDGDPSVSVPHKIHIPIRTNPQTFFFVGDERFHLEVGRAYELNNAASHAVVNGGETDRIHLIFEYLDFDLQRFEPLEKAAPSPS